MARDMTSNDGSHDTVLITGLMNRSIALANILQTEELITGFCEDIHCIEKAKISLPGQGCSGDLIELFFCSAVGVGSQAEEDGARGGNGFAAFQEGLK